MSEGVLSALPPEALNRHMAVLATSDAGKTYGMKTEVEQLLDAGRRVVVIDPTGVWYGLRLLPDGLTPSTHQLPIFGGVGAKGWAPPHCDVPIGATMGLRLAEIVSEGDFSCIIDVSRMSVGDRTRLLADFAEGLAQFSRRPLHLFIDEAHLFMPQGRVHDFESSRMLHACNALVAIGRAFGLRVVLMSQRPAKLHKDSLTLVQTLVVMQMIAPQDRAAVNDWIKEAADVAQGKEIMASLPGLQVGEGWVWSPRIGVLSRIKFPPLRTFDSSATPEHDDDAVVDVRLGALDIEQLRGLLTDDAAAVNDTAPTAPIDEARLQTAREKGYTDGVAEGRRLEREDYERRPLSAHPEVQRLIRLAEHSGRRAMAEALAGEFTAIVKREVASSSRPLAARPQDDVLPPRVELRDAPLSLPRSSKAAAATSPAREPALEAPPAGREPPAAPASDPPGGAALRLILALRGSPRPVTAEELAVIAGLLPGSGYLNAGMKVLRDGGWIRTEDAGRLVATTEGASADVAAADVFEGWVGRTSSEKGTGAAARLLRHIWEHPGRTRAQLCSDLSILPTSGYANAGFAALRRSPMVEEGEGGRWALNRLILDLQAADARRKG